MIYLSIILFAISALMGIIILKNWLSKKEASNRTIYSHGVTAVIALLLLIFYSLENEVNYFFINIILFSVAAIAGLYMFFTNANKERKPSSIVVAFIHALVAIIGFSILLFFVFLK